MSAIPPISAVMTASPFAVGIDTSVEEAQMIMNEKKFRHLPVVEGEKPVGILSDRDIALALLVNQGMESASTLRVGDICTLNAFSVTTEDSLDRVAETMAERQIGSALVVEGEKLVGIFTATDACKHLVSCLRDK